MIYFLGEFLSKIVTPLPIIYKICASEDNLFGNSWFQYVFIGFIEIISKILKIVIKLHSMFLVFELYQFFFDCCVVGFPKKISGKFNKIAI